MSWVPLGKTLLRNVIRHTDAHNKIQEESEMWKLRDMEKQATSAAPSKHRLKTDKHLSRGHMHCDRYLDESAVSTQTSREEKEARYWTRKLYEFESNDPDRWGHSGFKELYPEEFKTDSEEGCTDEENIQRKLKKCKSSRDSDKRKRSKKSTKKKKKKKEKKKRRTAGSDSESCSSTEDNDKRKQKRKSGKSKRRRKRTDRGKGKTEDSSTNNSDSEESRETGSRTPRKRYKSDTDAPSEPPKKRRKDWKVGNEERSEESSED
ncbi:uncharacterized protein NKAPD1 [Chanos chanos]|uniref:Uncharacterized protein NKAPD1 n=1 Tax=Chanos chanos TaxID=29144 RepID=A0A6J2VPB0_CHACN|nr:uncharacterized protein NKAPD1 [Chanos chanos]